MNLSNGDENPSMAALECLNLEMSGESIEQYPLAPQRNMLKRRTEAIDRKALA
jgi:hypothetical protein